MGLVMPYSKYSGSLCQPNDEDELTRMQLRSNAYIKKLAINLSQNSNVTSKYDVYQLLEDSLLGLYFDSNIPENYGLGNSGALLAALYEKYFAPGYRQDINLSNIKNIRTEFAFLEEFFHSASSGIDPLVSYINTPILLNAPVNNLDFLIPISIKLFLIDTETERQTKNFRLIFDNKCFENSKQIQKLIDLNNVCITLFLEDADDIFSSMLEFASLEMQFLNEMFSIPDKIASFQKDNSDKFIMKLCGSGGGGFLLGACSAQNFEEISDKLISLGIKFELLSSQRKKLVNCL